MKLNSYNGLDEAMKSLIDWFTIAVAAELVNDVLLQRFPDDEDNIREIKEQYFGEYIALKRSRGVQK